MQLGKCFWGKKEVSYLCNLGLEARGETSVAGLHGGEG